MKMKKYVKPDMDIEVLSSETILSTSLAIPDDTAVGANFFPDFD